MVQDMHPAAAVKCQSSHRSVTFDRLSIIINGQRVFLWAAEFHPFRLPVPGLWLDVLQKIKAMGYNAVSFYTDWALLEGQPGHLRCEGIFDFIPFFEATKKAGLWLIVRPGPYINAEVSSGGLPGWLQRSRAKLRTSDSEYLKPALDFMSAIAKICAPYQIAHGGPIILFQIENEYTLLEGDEPLDDRYMYALVDVVRKNGINVPLTFNDAKPLGTWSPETKDDLIDIYGWDGYPFGYGPGVTFCSDPVYWPSGVLPSKLFDFNTKKSLCPRNPFFLAEFQGSTIQGWGSEGPQTMCADLLNVDFERVVYKELLANGVRMLGRYMTFGGTNWGNLGFPGTTTSYDGGAAISEDRLLYRKKYHEARLQASFVNTSKSFLTSIPAEPVAGGPLSTTELTVTISHDTLSATKFYAVRHTDYTSKASTAYKLSMDTSLGKFTVPMLPEKSLLLFGRDSKIHVSDYAVESINLLYCTAEILSVIPSAEHTVLVLSGAEGEYHEFSMGPIKEPLFLQDNTAVARTAFAKFDVLSWHVDRTIQTIQVGHSLKIHLVPRDEAYGLWWIDAQVVDQNTTVPVLIRGGYLLRSAVIAGSRLSITGDITHTTSIQVIASALPLKHLSFNGRELRTEIRDGFLSGTAIYVDPKVSIADLSTLEWRFVDSLPELRSSYDDTRWFSCSTKTTNNPRGLTTATSLYGGDYGFHSGCLIFRGHFIADGEESVVQMITAGGAGYGHSVWLDSQFLGSWHGVANMAQCPTQYYVMPKLKKGTAHVFTVLIDNMGYEMQFIAQSESMKSPRGILEFCLKGKRLGPMTVSWKMTGNLGGEQYRDLERGPLNEGGLYAERLGWHQPGAVIDCPQRLCPSEGLSSAGVGMFFANLKLDLPKGYDIPLSFNFEAVAMSNFRAQLFVNGYQFGKFVNHLGPQTRFHVPEGILNYTGANHIVLLVWAMDRKGAQVKLSLSGTTPIQSGFGPIDPAPQPLWTPRPDAY